MTNGLRSMFALAWLAGCSSKAAEPPGNRTPVSGSGASDSGVTVLDSATPGNGRIVVAFTVDWEGAYISREGLDALASLRTAMGEVPVTHFVSAAYFTKKPRDYSKALGAMAEAIAPRDELAMHLHAWHSLATASRVKRKSRPSFLSGTDELLEFEDGDKGFDLDPDAYSVADLRALLRTSRTLLERTKHPISASFRAGGYLSTPSVLQALYEEGYAVDSSAFDHRQIADDRTDELANRVHEVWPDATTSSQPYAIPAGSGQLIELPIAAVTDYAKADEIVRVFEDAYERLRAHPERDVFVVISAHQETAADNAVNFKDALAKIRGGEAGKLLEFTTTEQAAARARQMLGSPKQ